MLCWELLQARCENMSQRNSMKPAYDYRIMVTYILGTHRKHKTPSSPQLNSNGANRRCQIHGFLATFPWKQTCLVCVIHPACCRSASNVSLFIFIPRSHWSITCSSRNIQAFSQKIPLIIDCQSESEHSVFVYCFIQIPADF